MDELKIGTVVEVLDMSVVGVVQELLSGGRVKVSAGGITLTCKRGRVRVTTKAPQAVRSTPNVAVSADDGTSNAPPLLLDLHGKTVDESLALVDEHISRAIMAGLGEVEIMHGVGSGRVRDAIHARLSSLAVVKKFEPKLTNRGVTRVFI